MKSKGRWIKISSAVFAMVMFVTACGESVADINQSNSDGADISTHSAVTNADETNASGQTDSGSAMPAFTAKDLEGNTVTESIFGEKDLTVVNIWGTFCGPCVREMPELGTWAKEMPDNVQLIGLVIDIAGDEDTEHHDLAVSIMENADADFTQIVANQDFADILKDVYGVPTTIFVDQDGNIVGEPIIGADVDGYKEFVEDYLNAQ